MAITINNKKVGSFLKDLNEAERIYLVHTLNLSNSIKKLIEKFHLSKKEVCETYKISPSKYNDFVCGNHEYDLKIMATTNDWFIVLESKALEDEVPVQFMGEKERRYKLKKSNNIKK